MANDEGASPSIVIPGTFADGYSAALARMIGVVAADLGFDNPTIDRMVTAAGSDLLARAREVVGSAHGDD